MCGYTCKYLNEQITFYPDNISTCCSKFASQRICEIENVKRIDFDNIMNLLPKEDKYFEIPKYYYDLINSFFE